MEPYFGVADDGGEKSQKSQINPRPFQAFVNRLTFVFEKHIIAFQHNRIDYPVVFVPLYMALHFHVVELVELPVFFKSFLTSAIGQPFIGILISNFFLLFIRVAVPNNTPGAELVAVGKLVAAGSDLHHCLPDLRRLHRSADR